MTMKPSRMIMIDARKSARRMGVATSRLRSFLMRMSTRLKPTPHMPPLMRFMPMMPGDQEVDVAAAGLGDLDLAAGERVLPAGRALERVVDAARAMVGLRARGIEPVLRRLSPGCARRTTRATRPRRRARAASRLGHRPDLQQRRRAEGRRAPAAAAARRPPPPRSASGGPVAEGDAQAHRSRIGKTKLQKTTSARGRTRGSGRGRGRAKAAQARAVRHSSRRCLPVSDTNTSSRLAWRVVRLAEAPAALRASRSSTAGIADVRLGHGEHQASGLRVDRRAPRAGRRRATAAGAPRPSSRRPRSRPRGRRPGSA